MTVLGVVPARGGSKGVPDKNLRVVGGHSLLARTAAAARGSRRLTRTVVCTDSPDIAEAARAVGLDVPFQRPPERAADDTPILPVLRHVVEALAAEGFRADVVVLLQPTSPFRRAEHIDAAVALLDDSGADSVVSVIEVPHHFNPVSVLTLTDGRLRPFTAGPLITLRQDKPRVYARNGPAVLAVRRQVLDRGDLYGDDCRPLMMTAADSVDIDDESDLEYADFLARRAHP